MAESSDRVLEILADVLDAPEADRGALLDRACAGEAATREQVERLLGLGPNAKEFLATIEAGRRGSRTPDAGADDEAVGELPCFGRYRALRLIGEGGMGSVYEAEQDHPRRRVAVKVVKLGMDTKRVLARFEAERETLGLMDHPNIARVFDAGVSETGRPFFVMELVKGVPITEYCDTHALGLRDRLALFIAVCRAVEHAHQKAIIHRDLKPSNMLVTMQDDAAVPKVIDFGIAKATGGQRLTEQTLLTEYRQLVGTPEYSSPEQAEMSGVDIDTRSDIYSLGVLLYELLTGTTPFDRSRLQASDSGELWRLIREMEPVKPSTKLSGLTDAGALKVAGRVATARGTDHGTLVRTVRGDLDWIVMKCLEKDRTRRYETANALALDIQRHLDNEPVSAGPPGVRYRLGKFARRYRVPLAAAALLVLVLMLGIIGTSIGLVRAHSAQTTAEREARKARDVSGYLQGMLLMPYADGSGADVRLVDAIDMVAAQMTVKLKDQPEVEMEARLAIHETFFALGLEERGEQNLQRAYDLLLKTGGDETEPGLKIRIWVADTFPDLPDRESFIRKAVADARRVLRHHEVTVNGTNILAMVLRDAGKPAEAEALLRPVAQQCREAPIPRANPFFFLGLVLWDQGKLDLAEDALREALDHAKRYTLGGRGWRVSVSRNLAELLASRSKLNQAAEVLEEALAANRPRLGGAHPQMSWVIGEYAAILHQLGRHEAAAHVIAEHKSALTSFVQLPATTRSGLERRAMAHVQLGHFEAAAEDYALCIKFDPNLHDAWGARAGLLANLDNRDAYERHCTQMVERFGRTTSRTIAERTAKMCSLLPRPPEQCKVLMTLADRALDADKPHKYQNSFRLAKGMAEYRSGHFEDAVDWLTRAREGLSMEGIATADLFLAMAHYQCGRASDARAWFARATERIDRTIPAPGMAQLSAGVPTCELLQREARKLIFGPIFGDPAGTRPVSIGRESGLEN